MPEPVRRILVVRAGALGDFLLGRPALAALRARSPAAHITVVAPQPQARIARWDGLADAVIGFDEPQLAPLIAGEAKEWPALLELPDVAVVWLKAHAHVRANAKRLGVRLTVGCAPLDAIRARRHVAAWLIESLAQLGVAEAQPPLLRPLGVQLPFERCIVLHPGSGSRRKNFPRWPAVLDRLAPAVPTVPAVVIEGPADEEAVAAVLRNWPAATAAPTIVRPTALEDLASHLAGAALYLGNDSGVSHLAAALGAPTVVAFGPTDPEIWQPVGPRVTVCGGARVDDGIFAGEPAWPGVDEVLAAARALLGQAE